MAVIVGWLTRQKHVQDDARALGYVPSGHFWHNYGIDGPFSLWFSLWTMMMFQSKITICKEVHLHRI